MTSPAALPTSKAEFLADFVAARAELESAIAHLTEAQLAAPSAPTDWSVKDHLAHLAMWAKGMVALLRQERRYPAMGLDEAFAWAATTDSDAINDVIYHQHRDRSLAEVRAEFDAVHQSVIDVVTAMPWRDLQRTYAHFQSFEPGDDDGLPILVRLMGNTGPHYREHIPWIVADLERRGFKKS